MEEEIDLRVYIEVLLRRWPWIVGLTLAAAIVAFVVSSFLTPIYEAETKVIILKSKTDILFEPTIRSEGEIADINIIEAQRTLLNLVKSSDVAATVLSEAEALLEPDTRRILPLLKKVEAANNGNIISIKVTDKDPVVASQLADQWAGAFENYVNQLFNDRSNILLQQVEAQVAEVENAYRLAQTNLENFVRHNQIDVLERDSESMKQSLDVKYEQLAQKYDELNRIERWLEDALTVQDQINTVPSSAGASIGDILALVGLREQGSQRSTPIQLQLNLAELQGNLVVPGDASSMVAVIEARKNRVEADIEALSAELALAEDEIRLSASSNQELPLNPLVAKILVLEAALEAQKAQERELRSARELAWENYKAVQRKLSEVTLDAQITDSEVRVAAHAIIPDDPVGPKRLLNTLIGGALGFMLAILAVFAKILWQSESQVLSEVESVQKNDLIPTC